MNIRGTGGRDEHDRRDLHRRDVNNNRATGAIELSLHRTVLHRKRRIALPCRISTRDHDERAILFPYYAYPP